jgi:hypothetical protein
VSTPVRPTGGAELELHSFLTVMIGVINLDLMERNNLGVIGIGTAILNLKNRF